MTALGHFDPFPPHRPNAGDAVYAGHFKCNLRRLIDYPNLWDYTRELFQFPRVATTVDFTHIKRHYYQSHKSINPTGVVPTGPELDFLSPHGLEFLPESGRRLGRRDAA